MSGQKRGFQPRMVEEKGKREFDYGELLGWLMSHSYRVSHSWFIPLLSQEEIKAWCCYFYPSFLCLCSMSGVNI
jgi:hypothetical protein